MGADQPVYYFKALWNEETFPSEICIKDLAADHLKKMKTVQPERPYFLGGHSVGGLIAFEMAQQLYSQGEQVALLFLLEPLSPVKFFSEEIAERIFLNSKKMVVNLWKSKFKMALRKLLGVSFNLMLNYGLLRFPFLKREYIYIVYYIPK